MTLPIAKPPLRCRSSRPRFKRGIRVLHLTDASDFAFAVRWHRLRTQVAQSCGLFRCADYHNQGWSDHLQGRDDFSPVYKVVPGSPIPFRRLSATRRLADAEWSSIVELPSGFVINARDRRQQNRHSRSTQECLTSGIALWLSLFSMALREAEIIYHLVTDASAEPSCGLEKGVLLLVSPSFATFGKSEPSDDSALLGFSPNVNGITTLIGPGTGLCLLSRKWRDRFH